MCTVSWAWENDGYVLFFNRDERHERAEAEPPKVWAEGVCRFLAPRDPQGGGTWIAVNARGLSIALLNYYEQAGVLPPGERSRGVLVRVLARAGDFGQMRSLLAGQDCGLYAPFHLLALAPEGGSALWTWNGRNMIFCPEIEGPGLLATSSHRPAETLAERRRAYAEAVKEPPPDRERLARFHRRHDSANPGTSVVMERNDARTVSLSEIAVNAEEVIFRYASRARGAAEFSDPVEARLPRD